MYLISWDYSKSNFEIKTSEFIIEDGVMIESYHLTYLNNCLQDYILERFLKSLRLTKRDLLSLEEVIEHTKEMISTYMNSMYCTNSGYAFCCRILDYCKLLALGKLVEIDLRYVVYEKIKEDF